MKKVPYLKKTVRKFLITERYSFRKIIFNVQRQIIDYVNSEDSYRSVDTGFKQRVCKTSR